MSDRDSAPLDEDGPAAPAAILAATPEPPGPDADPSEVTEVAARMLQARSPHFERLAELQASGADLSAIDPADRQLLADRDARWASCLASARHRLGEQLHALHRRPSCYR